MRRERIDTDYFRDLYAKNGDPWNFASSDYERQKYATTIAALPRARYARALEIGCSIGILTRMLAARCDELVCTEPVERAREQAVARCADLHHVSFLPLAAPGLWPTGSFDLIVLSEVVYYFTRDEVIQLVGRVHDTLAPGGHVLLVHYVRETDYPLSGDDAVAIFLEGSRPWLSVIRQERTTDYRLDLCVRPTSDDGATAPP